jgi:hypothetical protein
VKQTRWVGVALLLLVAGGSPSLFCQAGGSQPVPPQKARMCDDQGCYDFTWAGDHYDAVMEGKPGLFARFWITTWTADGIEFQGKTAFAVDGIYPAEGTYRGKISQRGNSIVGGIVDWRVGYGAHGSKPYTLTWANSSENAVEAADVAQFQPPQRSKTNPNILMPAGAAEVYASYPDAVRAILLPEYALTPKDAKRACHDPYVLDRNTALEIARFAYRAGDMKRGDCWLLTSEALNNTRARVIYATTFLYGWQGTAKDEAKGFGMLKLLMSTRDPWDIWLLNQCYIDGTGTPKDAHEAAILASYAMTHDDVYQVSQLIGSDDAAQVKQFERLQVLMNPPMKASTRCRAASPAERASPNVANGQYCESISVIDQDAVQRRLNAIDQQP